MAQSPAAHPAPSLTPPATADTPPAPPSASAATGEETRPGSAAPVTIVPADDRSLTATPAAASVHRADPTVAPTTTVVMQPPAADPTPFPPSTAARVLDIARAELPRFRALFRSGCTPVATSTCVPSYVTMGFKDQQELEQATVPVVYPIVTFDVHKLKTYAPGTRVATLIRPLPSWVPPVVGPGEGRSSMVVSFFHNPQGEAGEWGGSYESDALVQLHDRYAGRPVTISYILNEWWAPNMVLVTEDQQESLIVLRPSQRPQPVEPLPAEQIMPRIVEMWAAHEAGCPNPPCT